MDLYPPRVPHSIKGILVPHTYVPFNDGTLIYPLMWKQISKHSPNTEDMHTWAIYLVEYNLDFMRHVQYESRSRVWLRPGATALWRHQHGRYGFQNHITPTGRYRLRRVPIWKHVGTCVACACGEVWRKPRRKGVVCSRCGEVPKVVDVRSRRARWVTLGGSDGPLAWGI